MTQLRQVLPFDRLGIFKVQYFPDTTFQRISDGQAVNFDDMYIYAADTRALAK